VLGLPGNPTAALTTARLFLAPLVCQLAGAGFNHALRWHPRRLIEPVGPVGDRDEFLCASTEDAQTGSPTGVRVLARQEASAQMMLAHADLLVERRAGSPATGEGTMVRCLRF
jgi:molybdopterin molybdotransferase